MKENERASNFDKAEGVTSCVSFCSILGGYTENVKKTYLYFYLTLNFRFQYNDEIIVENYVRG